MSKDNIFDLSKIARTSYDVEDVIPKENIEALTAGYTEIPESEWKFIPVGSQVRYLRKDGTFRKGGILQNIYIKTDTNPEALKIEISAGYGDKKWFVNSTGIETIWAKKNLRPVGVGVAPRPAVTTEYIERIESCENSIKQLTIQIQQLKNDQFELIKLIKKLHKL